MVPLSPEAQGLLNRYNLTYDEVLFYESHHQIGKYVRRYCGSIDGDSLNYLRQIVPPYWHHDDAVGSYHDNVRERPTSRRTSRYTFSWHLAELIED